MALYGLHFAGSTPVGGPIMGWISEAWGPRVGLAIGGTLSLAAALAAVSRGAGAPTGGGAGAGEAHETPDIAVA